MSQVGSIDIIPHQVFSSPLTPKEGAGSLSVSGASPPLSQALNRLIDPAAFFEASEEATICTHSRPVAAVFQSDETTTHQTRVQQSSFGSIDYSLSLTSSAHNVNFTDSCTLSVLLNTLYRDRRREARVQSLEDVVILYSIPRLRRDGQPNEQWLNCDVIFENGERRGLQPRLSDPINGDRIFSLLLPVKKSDKKSTTSRARFFFHCVERTDFDRPSGLDPWYSVDIQQPGVYSIRDGELVLGDKNYDLGVVLILSRDAEGRLQSEPPVLHYLDEVNGRWSSRYFERLVCRILDNVTKSKPSLSWMCVLSGVRRSRFTVELNTTFYIKSERGEDLDVHWPGTYIVSSDGTLCALPGDICFQELENETLPTTTCVPTPDERTDIVNIQLCDKSDDLSTSES